MINDLLDQAGIRDVPEPLMETALPESFPESEAVAKPIITLPGGDVSITTTATELYRLIAPSFSLFIRGKVVVSLLKNITGQFVLEPMRPSAARSFFEQFARFVGNRVGRQGAAVLKPMVVPEETARALLDCHVTNELLPRVNGLVNCPVMVETPQGLRVCGKGYNAETGLLVLAGNTPENVSLPEAVASLLKLLADFDFQSPSDRSRALAASITPALKMGNLIKGYVPIDVAEADKSQSGKTYRQRMIAAIYNEKPALVPLKRNGVGGTDESLFEKLVNGRPFIQLDNFRGSLDSPALEALLTADGSFPCRIPHCREIEVDPSRFFILMTSNGVETTRDLANRSSIIRIKKREDGAQFPDTLGEIVARQPYYLGCVFAIIREWHRRGKPRTSETNHDFRDWCQSLDWIVQNLCGQARLMDGHVAAQERVSNPALTFLRRIALEVENQNLLDNPVTASKIFELADGADILIPGLRKDDASDEEKARKVIGGKLAPLFKDHTTVQLDGFAITRKEEQRPRKDGEGSFPVKTYTFVRPSQQPQ